MKGKIIALSVAFAFGAAAIAFSVRPAGVPSGKGSGKNASVDKPQELVGIVSSLPSAQDYYQMALQSKAKKAVKGVAAEAEITDGKFRPATVRDVTSFNTSVSDEYVYRDKTEYSPNHEETVYRTTKTVEVNLDREVVAHYAKDGVYYDIEGTVSQEQTDYECYYVDYGSHKQGNTEVKVTTKMEIDGAMYIGVKGVYFKYDNYEIKTSTVRTVNGKTVEDETEDTEISDIGEMSLKAIRDHYGKWIDALYEFDGNIDESTATDIDAIIQYSCAELSNMLSERFVECIDSNAQYMGKIANAGARAETKSNEYFEKDGDFYIATPFGRYSLLSDFGYEPSASELTSGGASGEDGKINYEKIYAVKNSSFLLDLTDGKNPAWQLNFSFNTSKKPSADQERRISSSMRQKLYVGNIDNVELPKISSSKNVYDFIGKDLKDYFIEHGYAKEGK